MITEAEWTSIGKYIEKIAGQVSGKRQDYFTTGQVIKVDIANRCVYLAELGDQPIPIVGWRYTVDYYYEDQSGNLTKRTATAQVIPPKVGDTIVVIKELGTRRLPRAIGILYGTNWIVAEEEE